MQPSLNNNSLIEPVTKQTGIFNLDQMVSAHIQQVLEVANGRIEGNNGAAELLGIYPGTIYPTVPGQSFTYLQCRI